MNFRKFLIPFLLISVYGCNAEAAPEKPNVVLILIDDLSHVGLGTYGGVAIHSQIGRFESRPTSTPRMDEIARQGVRCEHAFAYPLCESTRIALMSGLNNDRNYLNCKIQHASDITFGDVFQWAGYATGIFGKWKQTRGSRSIHAKDYIFEFGWDEFACFDVVGERQRFINPNLVINGEIHDYGGREDLDPNTGRRWYGPDICNRLALEFIDKNRDRPFFLYYPVMLVHDEHKPTPDTKPDSLFDNFPEQTRNFDGLIGDDHRYISDMLSYTDKLIGKVVDRLEEHGLTENTQVIVMGDNGTKEAFSHTLRDGTIYKGRKGGNADNGLHVPMILKMPGRIPSREDTRTYEGLVNLTDVFPTIADAAGIEIPHRDKMDGISFWDQLTGISSEEHRDVIYTWYNGSNPYTNQETILRYAFNKDFKRYAPTVHYPEGRFFDLRTDPFERIKDTVIKFRFGVLRYSGLDIGNLDEKQKKAYDMLGEVLKDHEYVPAKNLSINPKNLEMKTGERTVLSCNIIPENATRFGVIWESNDPEIASIDKFGEVTAHQNGTVEISVFSWHDAYPSAGNRDPEYDREGIRDKVEVTIQ